MDAGRSEARLSDVLDRVLDKGVVLDAHLRAGLVGVELLAVDARVEVASMETYLAHANALAYTRLAARPGGMRDALPPAASPPRSESTTVVPPTGVPLVAEPIAVEPEPPLVIERTDDIAAAHEGEEAGEVE